MVKNSALVNPFSIIFFIISLLFLYRWNFLFHFLVDF